MTYLPMLFTPVLILCIWIIVDELCKMDIRDDPRFCRDKALEFMRDAGDAE